MQEKFLDIDKVLQKHFWLIFTIIQAFLFLGIGLNVDSDSKLYMLAVSGANLNLRYPLLPWLTQLSYEFFGFNETALKLPTFICGTLSLVFLLLIYQELYPKRIKVKFILMLLLSMFPPFVLVQSSILTETGVCLSFTAILFILAKSKNLKLKTYLILLVVYISFFWRYTIIWLLPAIAIILFFLNYWNKVSFKKSFNLSIVFLLVTSLPFLIIMHFKKSDSKVWEGSCTGLFRHGIFDNNLPRFTPEMDFEYQSALRQWKAEEFPYEGLKIYSDRDRDGVFLHHYCIRNSMDFLKPIVIQQLSDKYNLYVKAFLRTLLYHAGFGILENINSFKSVKYSFNDYLSDCPYGSAKLQCKLSFKANYNFFSKKSLNSDYLIKLMNFLSPVYAYYLIFFFLVNIIFVYYSFKSKDLLIFATGLMAYFYLLLYLLMIHTWQRLGIPSQQLFLFLSVFFLDRYIRRFLKLYS